MSPEQRPQQHPDIPTDAERASRLYDLAVERGERIDQLQASLREVYDYMVEVESALAGQAAVRSYLSLPRTPEERVAIGKRARRLLGIPEPSA